MTPGEQKDDNGAIWKGLILASFIMLSMLTWASSPLQKLVEKVQHKQTVKAKLIVCAEIRAMIPVYQDWTAKLFKSGCVWEAGNWLKIINPEKFEKEIRPELDAQEGEWFDETLNRCSEGSSKTNCKIRSPIWSRHLCTSRNSIVLVFSKKLRN